MPKQEVPQHYLDANLLDACKEGHLNYAGLVIAAGSIVNGIGPNGNRPLHLAAVAGDKSIVQLLIDKGADVRARNTFNNAPSDTALSCGHDDIADLLKTDAKDHGHTARVTKDRSDKGPPQVGG
jgi:ankyrin repeat protein